LYHPYYTSINIYERAKDFELAKQGNAEALAPFINNLHNPSQQQLT